MCTSILYNAGDHYFGRNLDLEISFGQEVVVTPRDYQFDFRQIPALSHHYAIIGMAGLNFDGPAHYFPVEEGKDNVSPFEFIPYVLGQCKNVNEAKELMKNMSLVNINFSDQLQLSPLHWLIADRSGKSIVVESTESGLHVYDNPVNVLTNNPEFPEHMTNLANYQSVSPAEPANQLAPNVDLGTYSRGLGSHMLPGGMDSESRFVKEVFTLQHAPSGKSELENVTNYFHCLHAVEQQDGLDEVAPGQFEYTIYSDGINLSTGSYYYTTYQNNQINAVQMRHVNLNSQDLALFPLQTEQVLHFQN